MKNAPTFLALVLSLCACTVVPPVSEGYMPADAFSNTAPGEDQTVAATNTAAIAFAYPARMQGDPAGMALAIASLDAVAGQFANEGRFYDDDASLQLLTARDRVRQLLGVPQNTPSQSLIDHLVAASQALQAGNKPAALTALSGPDFTQPPAQTLAILTHFPYVPAADAAMYAAGQAEFPSSDESNGI